MSSDGKASDEAVDSDGEDDVPTTLDVSPDVLERIQNTVDTALLGERRYTAEQAAEQVGVSLERATKLWIAIGFAESDPGTQAYTDDDVAALRRIVQLTSAGIVDADMEVPITRALGQAFSRLADWEISILSSQVFRDVRGRIAEGIDTDTALMDALRNADELIPVLEEMHSYTWRRHAAAVARQALSADAGEDSRTLVVGFADMVGYTSLTRRIGVDDLSRLLEEFESTATSIITTHRGTVVKNVGDEVMFSVEDAADAAEIGLVLQEKIRDDDDLPAIRVGMARGPVLVRLGDLYGSVVNIAARLTTIAKPGTVVIDTGLSEALDDEDFRVKSLRSVRVRGYHRLKPHTLRRAHQSERKR